MNRYKVFFSYLIRRCIWQILASWLVVFGLFVVANFFIRSQSWDQKAANVFSVVQALIVLIIALVTLIAVFVFAKKSTNSFFTTIMCLIVALFSSGFLVFISLMYIAVTSF